MDRDGAVAAPALVLASDGAAAALTALVLAAAAALTAIALANDGAAAALTALVLASSHGAVAALMVPVLAPVLAIFGTCRLPGPVGMASP